jgi:RNA polymerase sigma-70 factor, ECF subfamily
VVGRCARERWLLESPVFANLVRRCRQGDAAAWEELVGQIGRRVYNICYRFTGSNEQADDLTQEVCIRMYRSLDSFDPERAAFMTWVTTIARNLLVDHFRKTQYDRRTSSLDTSPAAEDDDLSLGERIPDSRPSPEARVHSRETQAMVQQALQRLSPELREAVILRDLQDMDYKEIAGTLNIPEGTVKSRINRGRSELARLLSRTQKQAG